MSLPIIEGTQLYLRSIEHADIDGGWLDWLNDPLTNAFLAGPTQVTRRELERYLDASQPPHAYMFAICERSTERYVGNARLSGVDTRHRRASIGWLIGNPSDRGRGFGTEALSLLLRFAFSHTDFQRISSAAQTRNSAAIRAHEKAGFQREGVLRDYILRDGQFHDVVQFSMLRHEFERMYDIGEDLGAPAQASEASGAPSGGGAPTAVALENTATLRRSRS